MEEFDYYRIEVATHSKNRNIVFGSVLFLYANAVWFWPQYLPALAKVVIILLAVITTMFFLNRSKQIPNFVAKLSQHKKLSIDEGYMCGDYEITKWSYVLPWAVHLKLKSPLGQPSKWLSLYNDQIDNVSLRRLRRAVIKIKHNN